MKQFFSTFWNSISLPVGYIFAGVIILISPRSKQGYWKDLKGEPGRLLAKEWGDSILIALVLALFLRTFFIQVFRIPSGSMRMTLIEGDRLLVNKLRYGPKVPFTRSRFPGFSHPKRGDVIVFRFPMDRKKDFIKRLIAFGGETVEIKNGDIYIDGKRVDLPAVDVHKYYNRGDYGDVGVRTKVPEGYIFVLGDNSASSHDSRYWGFVPEDDIIGKAEFIYWPFNRFSLIK